MSTDTQNSPKQGSSRRRRSRGGQNRSKTNNSTRSSTDGHQSSSSSSSSSSSRSSRQSSSKSHYRRAMPAPELSWWQKLLKTIGLFKDPVRPPRPDRRTSTPDTIQTREPHRSKTRDARTDQGSSTESKKQSRDYRAPKSGDRTPKSGNRPRGGDPSTVENRRVYVGNLSYDTTESDLEELFKGVGAVRQIEIVYNRSTHRSKGYGFIEMLDIDEAKRTVEVLHDQFFMGRKLTVSGAKSKDHENAENEEGSNTETTIPPLAPVNPEKEEVLNLIEEPAAVETTPENSNSEVPMEEFTSEEAAPEEAKEEAKA